MNKSLTKNKFDEYLVRDRNYFTEYKTEKDIYRIEYLDSFLKCAIQKTEEGVQIIYLDSLYVNDWHIEKLLGYATFQIAQKINDGKEFSEIEFNKDGHIISINN